MNGVGFEEELTFGKHGLFDEFVLHPLQIEGDPRPHGVGTRPHA